MLKKLKWEPIKSYTFAGKSDFSVGNAPPDVRTVEAVDDFRGDDDFFRATDECLALYTVDGDAELEITTVQL